MDAEKDADLIVDPNWVGPRIRELREAAGLSRAELAERSGMSVHAVADYEQGRRHPSWEMLVHLCRGLKVRAAAFEEPPTKVWVPGGLQPLPRGRPRTKKNPAEPIGPKRGRGRPRKDAAPAEPTPAE